MPPSQRRVYNSPNALPPPLRGRDGVGGKIHIGIFLYFNMIVGYTHPSP
jgi:hypothetical protein